MTDVDTTASDVLTELDEELNARGISLVFAELKDPVRRKIERYGLTRTIEPRHFYPTITAAVTAFREETGAQWASGGQPDGGQPSGGQPSGGQPDGSQPADDRPAPGQIAADSGPPSDIPAAPPAG